MLVFVLTAYAAAVFVFVSRNLSNALDDRVRDDFQWAMAMADLQRDGTLRWFDDEDAIDEENSPWLTVWSNGQVIFRYVGAASGEPTSAANPNGAAHNIAGICSERRNVVGMMPHPERACEPMLGSGDGLVLFESVVRALSAGAVGTAAR